MVIELEGQSLIRLNQLNQCHQCAIIVDGSTLMTLIRHDFYGLKK